MLRLTLFGGFALAGPDGATVVIASRKCRALLAYLALAPRPTPRERLAGLLWGDGPEERARGSLRQALTTLRREVPGDGSWLSANTETVSLNHDVLRVDVREADARLAAGEVAQALDLCAAGELLAGLGSVTPELDEWREREQRSWRDKEANALRASSQAVRVPGRERELLALARRRLRLEPWNEEAQRDAMWALAALGQHAEALRQYQEACRALRDELAVAPSPETERLIVRIRAVRNAAPPPEPAAEPPPVRADDPVGREVELHQIDGLLQGCRASGRGHVIVVRGEAGIGKSTFAQQVLRRAAAAGFAVHLVSATELGAGRNLDVARGVLDALESDADAPPEHRIALTELRGAALDAAQAALADALDPDARAVAHTRALEALVAAAGARQPRVLVVEDLHWCDAETTRLLCSVAAAAPEHRTVVLFTCRSGEEPAELAWAALVRRGSLTSFDLGPLTDADVARLAARHARLPPEVARRCIERAAGHPLFLLQLLDSGGASDGVPESVQTAVLARLGRLPPGERRLLGAAAILGAPFTAPQIARVLDEEHVDVGPAVQQGWLRPAGTRLVLAHDLLASAIRSSLDDASRASFHRRAAAWFAAREPLTSAEHLERAGDPGAAPAYLSVAREAVAQHRLDLAESVLARVDACEPQPALAFEAVCLRGDVRRERGDAAGSHAVFARAAGLARTREEHVRAKLGVAAALRLLDRPDEALACLAEAETFADPQDDGVRTQLEQLRGNLLFALGDPARCRAAHERALRHARAAESPLDEAAALSGLGDAHYLAGRLHSAARTFEVCRALSAAHGVLRLEGASSMMLALTAVYENQLDAALAFIARASELGGRTSQLRLECLAASVASFLERERGDWAAARARAEVCLAVARRLGSERLESLGLEGLARAQLHEGRRGEALTVARQALALCERSGGAPLVGPSIFATIALAERGVEAQRAAIRRGEEQLAAGGSTFHNHVELRSAAMLVARRRGDWDEAARHAAALDAQQGDERTAYAALLTDGLRLAQAAETASAGHAARELAMLRGRASAAGLVLLARYLDDRGFTPD